MTLLQPVLLFKCLLQAAKEPRRTSTLCSQPADRSALLDVDEIIEGAFALRSKCEVLGKCFS